MASKNKSVVLYESNGEWTRALRRFIVQDIRVVERPSVPMVDPSRETCPWASLLVVTPEMEAEQVLRWSGLLHAYRPSGLHMAVVRPSSHELAWCLREIGNTMVWDEFWQAPKMARMVDRFWQRASLPDLSIEEEIWNNLPWNRVDPVGDQ